MATPFLGMRGTGDWDSDARPQNYREAILYLYPNGKTPITGVMSMLDNEAVDDPIFHWFERGLAVQGGVVADVFDDALLVTSYTSGGVAGTVLYAQVAQAVAEEFKIGHTCTFEKVDTANDGQDADARVETQGEVVSTSLAGANSYVAVKLHEAATAAQDLDTADYLAVVGSIHEEGADMPDSITYDPTEFFNYTQIFRTSLSLTRTARKTRIRYGSDAYKLAKREALELHAIEMEKAAIWGKRYTTTGIKGQPKRATGGLIWTLNNFESDNVIDYRYATDVTAGASWAAEGEEWLNSHLTRLMSKGSDEKMAVVGYGASKGLNELVAAGSQFNWVSRDRAYGIRVTEWLVANGVLNMKIHPLFGERLNYRSAMLIYEPSRFKYRYIDDTDFIEDPPDKTNRNNGRDATDEEYLTEAGFEYHNTETAMLFLGVGEDNTL